MKYEDKQGVCILKNEMLIQKIEELSMNAFPSLETDHVDGWLLRISNGYSKRTNSINPLYESNKETSEKMEKAEHVYRKKNLPVIYKLTSHVFPENLDNILAQANYSFESLTSVQLLPLNEATLTFSPSSSFVIYNSLEDKWFDSFCELNRVRETDQPILKKMLENIVPQVCYVILFNDKDEVIACGMGVLEDGFIGLFDIVTNSNYRNKGYGMQLISAILEWGKTNGAKNAYLQVVSDNIPALNLYAKMGFKEAYQYWYRIKK